MGADSQFPPRPEGSAPARVRFGAAWLQRANTTLLLVLLLAGMGFAFRAFSKRAAEDLRVPGIYVRVRPAQGGLVEARAAPLPFRRASGPEITLEVSLVDVASLVQLLEEVSRARVVLEGRVEQRVSLKAQKAPLEAALEAVAAAANLTLRVRDGGFVLSAATPEGASPVPAPQR